ncbi:MAG: hypothetical protein F6J93_36390 [Oscillatoria sp. SIO1A7]|nr:hypothetical protein [Oscillatoria sp. SIO1A7]
MKTEQGSSDCIGSERPMATEIGELAVCEFATPTDSIEPIGEDQGCLTAAGAKLLNLGGRGRESIATIEQPAYSSYTPYKETPSCASWSSSFLALAALVQACASLLEQIRLWLHKTKD